MSSSNRLPMADPTPAALVPSGLSPSDEAALRAALRRLQRSRGVVVRAADLLASILGPAASLGLRRLSIPPALVDKGQALAEAALRRAFDVAVIGVSSGRKRRLRVGKRMTRVIAASSGAVGGWAGVAGFVPDMMLTTMLIMRRIASIAQEEGEDLSTEQARAACLEVFAFDSSLKGSGLEEEAEGNPEVRYWTARFLLQGRPLVFLLSEVAATYGLRVSQKIALQAVPLVGAAGGALVNSVFLDHYQTRARVHFATRRLERTYGSAQVRAAWERARENLPA